MDRVERRSPYGLACMNCFKTKSKCVATPDGRSCHRCHRLNKECLPSNSLRKRYSKKALAERLDSLTALLEAIQAASGATTAGTGGIPHSPSSTTGSASASAASHPSPISADYFASPHGAQSAEQSFAIFRDQMLPYCPFIYIPATVPAQQLQREQPYLFRAIMVVTMRSVPERASQGSTLKRLLSDAIVVEERSDFDLLLAALTYVAWGHDQFTNGPATTPRMMDLALSIVCGLRWNKPLPINAHMLPMMGVPSYPGLSPIVCSLEEQRAVLGCFLLSSFVSTYFGQMECMRWTPQMDGFLQTIEANTTCPSDPMLAVLVRLQRVVHGAECTRDVHQGMMPIGLFTSSLLSQVRQIVESMPPELQIKEVFRLQLHYTELSIHETAFTANIHPTNLNLQSALDTSSGPSLTEDQVVCMWSSLQAIESWVEVLFRIPPIEYEAFPIGMVAQVGRVLVTLYRLSTHPSPTWDCLEVWRTVDIVDVIGKITSNMQSIPKQGEESVPADPGQELKCARFCNSIQAILEGNEDVEEPSPAGVGETGRGGAGVGAGGSVQQQYYQASGSSLGSGSEANTSFISSSETDMPFSWTPDWPGRSL
ncbi:hypothetical protein ASPCAL13546 [Aspergillus calidoustus]|uniref:Zn(2)-C6 fungal-type domain-containing protein n=1 Tax=Aspergillus calidoustus TaxID=454130 RepID=A0A0U5GEX5_ASPCI|nr:hypothetical protein ASPCAL13546 [Aspergillus calidoustus]